MASGLVGSAWDPIGYFSLPDLFLVGLGVMFEPCVLFEMSPSNQKFYFILQYVTVIGVISIVPMKPVGLSLVPLEGTCFHLFRPLNYAFIPYLH